MRGVSHQKLGVTGACAATPRDGRRPGTLGARVAATPAIELAQAERKAAQKVQRKAEKRKQGAEKRKQARKAAAAAAPGGISLRNNGWTKSGASAASDSGVSSAAASPVPGRKAAAPVQVKVLRKKVMAWNDATLAARSAPLVVKKHYCTHAACATS